MLLHNTFNYKYTINKKCLSVYRLTVLNISKPLHTRIQIIFVYNNITNNSYSENIVTNFVESIATHTSG